MPPYQFPAPADSAHTEKTNEIKKRKKTRENKPARGKPGTDRLDVARPHPIAD